MSILAIEYFSGYLICHGVLPVVKHWYFWWTFIWFDFNENDLSEVISLIDGLTSRNLFAFFLQIPFSLFFHRMNPLLSVFQGFTFWDIFIVDFFLLKLFNIFAFSMVRSIYMEELFSCHPHVKRTVFASGIRWKNNDTRKTWRLWSQRLSQKIEALLMSNRKIEILNKGKFIHGILPCYSLLVVTKGSIPIHPLSFVRKPWWTPTFLMSWEYCRHVCLENWKTEKFANAGVTPNGNQSASGNQNFSCLHMKKNGVSSCVRLNVACFLFRICFLLYRPLKIRSLLYVIDLKEPLDKTYLRRIDGVRIQGVPFQTRCPLSEEHRV